MQLRASHAAEIAHKTELMKLEVEKAKDLAEIECTKFKQTVDAIGADTIAQIAQAGPEMQAKLLGGLGLQGYLVTDGKSPINLFQTAQGLVGGAGGAGTWGRGKLTGACPARWRAVSQVALVCSRA